MTRQSSRKLSRTQKLVAVAGGFMILAGVVLLGMAALATTGFLSVELLLENKFVLTFSLLMVSVGLFDTFAAIIIARW